MYFIGEAALSAFFQTLFSKFASNSHFKLVSSEQVRKEIEKWDKTLKMIYAVLADAEGKQMQNQAVKIWLADLKDLTYDVDDILDEFSTKALECKLMKEHHDQASTRKIPKLLTFGSPFNPSTIMFNNKMISKMRDITSRLESLAVQKNQLLLRDQNDVKGIIPKRPESSSLLDETTIYGRQKDKEEILGMLFRNDDSIDGRISVIPIVGFGGIGKTALAQLVYNDDSLKDHFDLKAWVCVSDEFDVVNITKIILLSVSAQPCVENDLNSLQVKLKEKLSGKKFFFVLDDVWNENYEDWMVLRCPFDAGAPGSKIIVTTRSSKVSSIMRSVPDHLLQKLSDDYSICMLAHHALGARDFNGHPELKGIGLKIMKKCDGLPLATKTIAGLLRNNFNREAWKQILESQIWNSTSHIMPALWLSYYHLPSQLKQCFACCSLIPKDYEFDEDELIPLWMAEGFLHQANTIMSSEDLGGQYFKELVSRSFFQAATKEKSKFIMHDLINDLAQSVAQGFCFRMEEHQQMKIPRPTRHLSYYTVSCYDGFQKFHTVYEAKHLRTFHSFRMPVFSTCYLSHNVVIDVMSKLRYLRVLSLKRYQIYEIPDSIGNLKHLRFLDVSYTEINCLPDSICNLYHLETLKLRGCRKITKLPSKIGILINLCHLDICRAYLIKNMPSGIGGLTSLRVLSNFIVGQGDAANIREMQDLSGLKGKICISELQNVNEAYNAFEARMSYKAGISDLKLEWSGNFNKNLRNKRVEIDVLSFLKPHEELKVLTISYYAGTVFPSWIEDPLFENLQSLTLEGCRNCKSLPAVGKLPLLKNLCIKEMDDVISVGNEFYGENLTNAFPLLESLRFEDMPKWRKWKSGEVDEQGKLFHRLREIYIRNCPKLAEGFSVNGFCSLEELQISYCEELKVSISTLPMLRVLKIDGCKEVVFGSYRDICSVKSVLLSKISKLACESNEMVMLESIKVETLVVNASWWQTKWEWLADLESLKDLNIKKCPEVVNVGATKIKEEEKEVLLQLDIPWYIGHMRIEDCKSFMKISKSFQNLQCLSDLKIINCGKLASIETNTLPPTLTNLEIGYCENLQCLLDDREDDNFSSTFLLESLVIRGCKALDSLSSSRKLPICLKSLKIYTCEKMECLLDDEENINFISTSLLEFLYVWECYGLKSLSSSGKLPLRLKSLEIAACPEIEFAAQRIGDNASLEYIEIHGCRKFKFLPLGLEKLSRLYSIRIHSCPELVCLPAMGFPAYTNLKSMWLSQCEKLEALPDLYSLLRLQVLRIYECPKLKSMLSERSFGLPTNLTSLEVHGPDMNKAIMEWGLHRLVSLKSLCIFDLMPFPEEKDEIEMKLPASLTHLTIVTIKNVREISAHSFQNLTSLQSLSIENCPNLKSLPIKEMLPSLMSLYIRNCPELKKRCQRDTGKLWSSIAHIPLVRIDGKDIYE